MINPDEQASLEEERRFLLESLRDLEREYAAGDIDSRIEAMEKDRKRIRDLFPNMKLEEWDANTK